MKLTFTGTISATALITDKQRDLIDKLAQEREWRQAPTTVSLTIKRVTRWIAAPQPKSELDVLRKAASEAISYLLAPTTPKVQVTPTAATKPGTVSDWGTLKTKLALLPLSKYALKNEFDPDPDAWVFYEVVERKSGARFVNKLLGAPGDWKRVMLTVAQQIIIADKISEDPTEHATRYCKVFTRCSCCDSPLSNKVSISEAMGPVCRKKFSW